MFKEQFGSSKRRREEDLKRRELDIKRRIFQLFLRVKVDKDTSFGKLRAAKGEKSGNEGRNGGRRAKKGKVTWGREEENK